MHRGIMLAALLILSQTSMFSAADAQPPPEFSLEQNDPNPFCGTTVIRFALPEVFHARLEVRTTDDAATVRLLIEGLLMAGLYSVEWDGKDDDGVSVPDGDYPYRLTVTEGAGGPVIFEDAKTASVRCSNPVEGATWGAIKATFVAASVD